MATRDDRAEPATFREVRKLVRRQSIIDYRNQHGDFSFVADLKKVTGLHALTIGLLEPSLIVNLGGE